MSPLSFEPFRPTGGRWDGGTVGIGIGPIPITLGDITTIRIALSHGGFRCRRLMLEAKGRRGADHSNDAYVLGYFAGDLNLFESIGAPVSTFGAPTGLGLSDLRPHGAGAGEEFSIVLSRSVGRASERSPKVLYVTGWILGHLPLDTLSEVVARWRAKPRRRATAAR